MQGLLSPERTTLSIENSLPAGSDDQRGAAGGMERVSFEVPIHPANRQPACRDFIWKRISIARVQMISPGL